MRRQRENAALAQKALARLVANGDAAEPASVDVGDAVVPGQTFIYESIVGSHQIENAAVLPQDASKEELRFAAEALTQIVVEVGVQIGVGLEIPQVAQLQP